MFTLYIISFSKQLLKVLYLAENLRNYYLLQFYWLCQGIFQSKKGKVPISIPRRPVFSLLAFETLLPIVLGCWSTLLVNSMLLH